MGIIVRNASASYRPVQLSEISREERRRVAESGDGRDETRDGEDGDDGDRKGKRAREITKEGQKESVKSCVIIVNMAAEDAVLSY